MARINKSKVDFSLVIGMPVTVCVSDTLQLSEGIFMALGLPKE
jgi:hypothetical protein